MSRYHVCMMVACLVVGVTRVFGQSPLPMVEDIDAKALRQQCERLRAAMPSHLAPDDLLALAKLANTRDPIPKDFGEQVQKTLDPHCLIAVNINPESRVKAARGPRASELE